MVLADRTFPAILRFSVDLFNHLCASRPGCPQRRGCAKRADMPEPLISEANHYRAVLRAPAAPRPWAGLPPMGSGSRAAPPPLIVDDTDRALLRHLLMFGKSTNRVLAQHLSMSESSISVRLSKLAVMGLLVVASVIDWQVAGFERLVICRAKTQTRTPRDIAVEISTYPQATSVALAHGTYSVLGYFLVRDHEEQMSLVSRFGAVDGIAEFDVAVSTDAAMTAHGQRLFLSRNSSPIRLAAPKIDIDDLDIAIIQAPIDDGRQSSRTIARRLDVSEISVRARIARLTESGLVSTVAMVEPVASGMIGAIVAVWIRADQAQMHIIVEKIAATMNVAFSAVCVGAWDLHITVTGATIGQAMDTVKTLSAIDGVLETDTLPLVDVISMNPYLGRVRRTHPVGSLCARNAENHF